MNIRHVNKIIPICSYSITFQYIPNNQIMISLDVSLLYTKVPLELVLKGIGKRQPHIIIVTNLPNNEFKNGIQFLISSKDLGSNPGTVESVSFSTEIF